MSDQVPRTNKNSNPPRQDRAANESPAAQPEDRTRLPGQPETLDEATQGVPKTGPDAHDPTRFDHNANVPGRESESSAPAPAMATGMFLPVVILIVVAIVAIAWYLFF